MTKKNPVAKAAAKRTAVKAKTPLLTKIEKFQHDPKLLKTGMRAKFSRLDTGGTVVSAEGRICVVARSRIYFVSDNPKFEGVELKGRLGYRYSWIVSDNLSDGWFTEILPAEKDFVLPVSISINGRQVQIYADQIEVGCTIVPRKQVEEIYNEMNRLKGLKTKKNA